MSDMPLRHFWYEYPVGKDFTPHFMLAKEASLYLVHKGPSSEWVDSSWPPRNRFDAPRSRYQYHIVRGTCKTISGPSPLDVQGSSRAFPGRTSGEVTPSRTETSCYLVDRANVAVTVPMCALTDVNAFDIDVYKSPAISPRLAYKRSFVLMAPLSDGCPDGHQVGDGANADSEKRAGVAKRWMSWANLSTF